MSLTPITRKENFMARAAGNPGLELEPITREEHFLQDIVDAQGGGGGGSVTSVNGQTGAVVLNAEDVGAEPMESITYTALKALRDGGNLIPGKQYRITDYVCTVANDSEARAIFHPYDIIVTADDESTLNENARACLHEGDDYYSAQGAQADLSAWELKYCIDNDTNRFAWADSVNGKGVVFWLKDDWGNECPYDFKQIQFKRYKITACTKSPNLVDTYLAASEVSGDITADLTDFIWAYTFSGVLDESLIDTSVYNWVYSGRRGTCHCYDNTIKTSMKADRSIRGIRLNNIVFLASEIPCWSNTFGNNCGSNTFGNGCGSNTFGNNCESNTFGNNCESNTFGNFCESNTFGNNCESNTFGNFCGFNTFGNGCGFNTFGNNCGFNTFGNNCGSNTFGNGCGSNTFGNNCGYNTFGNNCGFNTFGNNAQGDEASAYCRWCTFEDGVKGVVLSNDNASDANQIQNYHVLNGTQGVMKTGLVAGNPVLTPITINASLGLSYCTYVGKNTSGTVKTYNIMDGAI